MRGWNIAANSHPDHMLGSVDVWDEPWWLALYGAALDALAGIFLSRALRAVPLPSWPRRQWQHCKPGERYTPREYFGSLGDLLFSTVHDRLFQAYWKRHQPYEITVDIGYTRLAELFRAHDPTFFRSFDECNDTTSRK